MRLEHPRRSDDEVLREILTLVERERRRTAALLAHVGEIQARGLYRPAGHSSMIEYLVYQHHMPEDEAGMCTTVARLARRFPVVFEMVADGRLHLAGAARLEPFCEVPDFLQLLDAAAHRTESEIEQLLAARFPQPLDVSTPDDAT